MDDSSEHSLIGNTNQPSTIDHNATSSLVLTTAEIHCVVPSLMTNSHTLPIIDNCKESFGYDGNVDRGLSGDGQESSPMGAVC